MYDLNESNLQTLIKIILLKLNSNQRQKNKYKYINWCRESELEKKEKCKKKKSSECLLTLLSNASVSNSLHLIVSIKVKKN